MSRGSDDWVRTALLWAVPTFVLNLVLNHGDVVHAAGVAAIVAAVGVPLERRMNRD